MSLKIGAKVKPFFPEAGLPEAGILTINNPWNETPNTVTAMDVREDASSQETQNIPPAVTAAPMKSPSLMASATFSFTPLQTTFTANATPPHLSLGSCGSLQARVTYPAPAPLQVPTTIKQEDIERAEKLRSALKHINSRAGRDDIAQTVYTRLGISNATVEQPRPAPAFSLATSRSLQARVAYPAPAPCAFSGMSIQAQFRVAEIHKMIAEIYALSPLLHEHRERIALLQSELDSLQSQQRTVLGHLHATSMLSPEPRAHQLSASITQEDVIRAARLRSALNHIHSPAGKDEIVHAVAVKLEIHTRRNEQRTPAPLFTFGGRKRKRDDGNEGTKQFTYVFP